MTNREKESIFPLAAEVTLFMQQGSELTSFPVNVSAIFGKQQVLEANGDGYEVSFREVTLELILGNARVLPKPKRYRRTLSEEEFSLVVSEARERSNNAKAGAKAGISLSLPALMNAMGLTFSAESSAMLEKRKNHSSKENSKSRLALVQESSGNRWRIGNYVIGDPTKGDSALEGEYFSDPSDHDVADDFPILCAIQRIEAQRDIDIEIRLLASIKGCRLVRVEDGEPVDEVVRQRKSEQIYALAEVRKIQERQKLFVPKPHEGEIVVARCALTLE